MILSRLRVVSSVLANPSGSQKKKTVRTMKSGGGRENDLHTLQSGHEKGKFERDCGRRGSKKASCCSGGVVIFGPVPAGDSFSGRSSSKIHCDQRSRHGRREVISAKEGT